jgi:transcriptional regulator with GAF, ATPase, and Fis domain
MTDVVESETRSRWADAEAFARLAEELHGKPDVPQTVELTLAFARQTLAADSASLVLVHGERELETAGFTDELAAEADRLQVEADEGPCLTMLLGEDYADGGYRIGDAAIDPRWPRWGERIAVDLGLHSVLSVRVGVTGSTLGALNLYAAGRDRFDADAAATAHILARHSAVALATTRHEAGLWVTIDARKLIGQAQGMLMERFDLDPDQAFDLLRRYSQSNGVKLKDVAAHLVGTRRLLPDGD